LISLVCSALSTPTTESTCSASASSTLSTASSPVRLPAASSTGSRRTPASRILASASRMSSSSRIVASGCDMMSPAVSVAGSSASATVSITMSRSVTMPAGLSRRPLSSSTTTLPTCWLRMICAHCVSVVCGVTVTTSRTARSPIRTDFALIDASVFAMTIGPRLRSWIHHRRARGAPR